MVVLSCHIIRLIVGERVLGGALGTNSTSDSSTPTPIYTDGDLSGKTIK